MAIEVDTVTLPAYWASALVNGDFSGLTPAERDALHASLASLQARGWYVVSTTEDDSRFTWSFRLYGGTADGGDVLDYIVHRMAS